jgi:selenoprotein W-related protein
LLTDFKRAIRRYELIPSGGGCFELTVGGKLIYSKLQTGTFPDEAEMIRAVGEALGA